MGNITRILMCFGFLGIFVKNDPNQYKKGFTGLIGSVAPTIAIQKLDPSLLGKKNLDPNSVLVPAVFLAGAFF